REYTSCRRKPASSGFRETLKGSVVEFRPSSSEFSSRRWVPACAGTTAIAGIYVMPAKADIQWLSRNSEGIGRRVSTVFVRIFLKTLGSGLRRNDGNRGNIRHAGESRHPVAFAKL